MKTATYYLIFIALSVYNCNFLFAQENRVLKNDLNFSMTDKPFFKNQQRIPQPITTNNYDLKYHRFNWVIDPAQRFISGSVTSYFVATQEQLNSIQFQLSASMSADSAVYNGKTLEINHTGNLITIPLNPFVSLGKFDSLTVFYHGIPEQNGSGSFVNYVHNGVPSMWTLSEPYGASDWWPSKNNLNDKIDSIDVFVVMPKGNHAASNGILVSEIPYGDNSTLAHWKHRYPIVSYLVAVAVTNYARYSDYYKIGSDSIEILNYVYPEDSTELRAKTPELLKSMALFEQLFSPYPFKKEKYGHAQTNMSGGMEHQTMTFLGKSSFDFYIMTHELAHQWFGDMITCGSWQDIWLNEGFATYCYALSLEYLYSEVKFKDYLKEMSHYITTKQQGSVFCNDTTNVSRIFSGGLSYYKGAILLNMLRWVLGDNDFFQGIRNYLNDPELKYGFALTQKLKMHFENQSGKDLSEFFEDWFYGTGVPAYNIQIKQQLNLNASTTILQTQYESDVSFFDMILPIKFIGEKKDTTILFNHTFSGQTFEFKPDFKIDSVIFDPEIKILYRKAEIILNQVSSIQDNIEDKILILSNPAKGILNIHVKSGSINYLKIFNLEGKSENVKLVKQENTLLELDIQNLQPGMYILKIGTSEWTETKKFIVIK
ncbi:MAG: T9SS type A sorting domain-containing protein [Paludibacter sp.]|nr:T9SS type A sorting domain-containing protein [Paludibacter sp.]